VRDLHALSEVCVGLKHDRYNGPTAHGCKAAVLRLRHCSHLLRVGEADTVQHISTYALRTFNKPHPGLTGARVSNTQARLARVGEPWADSAVFGDCR
jgi:hypothetical protein